MNKTTFFKSWLLLLCMIVGSSAAWAAQKITDYTDIVSGQQYYIGATISNTDYYFYAYGAYAGTGVQGTSKTDKSDASVFVFEGSGSSWTIKFADSGKYLSLASSKANGKVNVVADAASWELSNTTKNLIQMKINGYLLQRNNSTTTQNFGSYASGQTDVWLEPVVDESPLSSISVDVTGATTVFTEGDEFSSAGVVVTATYEDLSTSDVSSKATFSGYDMSTTGSQEVTVSYTEGGVTKTATYDITVNAIPTHKVTWSVNGSTTQETYKEGASITFPANPGDINDKKFMGWVSTAISGTTNDAPTFVTSATMGTEDVTYYAVFATVTGSISNKTDVLDREFTGVPAAQSYKDWSDKEGVSGAKYAGNSAGGSDAKPCIQLRSNNSNSGVITTTSGGKAKSITITWDSDTQSGRTLNIYGKNSAYTAASNLYDSSNQGTLLGTFAYGSQATATLTITGDYEYIGFRSASGALYLEKVEIVWESGSGSYSDYCTTVAADTRADAELSFSDSELNVNVGENFNVPTLNTAAGFNGTVEYSSSNENVAQITDIETGDLVIVGEGTTIITATFAGDNNFKPGYASYTLNVTDNRIATKITQDNIVLGISEVATLTQLTPVVKDANDNVVAYDNTGALPEVYFNLDNDDNSIIGSLDGNGAITLNSVIGTATITATYNHFNENATYKPSSCTFTITVESVLSIADARDQGTGDVTTKGVVTSVNGKTAYIQDATAAIVVFGTSNLTCVVGDEIKVSGTLTDYNGLLEIKDPTYTVLSQNNTVTPAVMTIADIKTSTNQGWLVKIEGATVTEIDSKNVTIEQGGESIVVRFNDTKDITFAVDDVITLTGNIGCYNTAQIANPTDISVAADTTPSVTVSETEINVDAAEHEGTITVTYANISDIIADVVFCDATGAAAPAKPTWITAEINNENNIYYVISANTGEARTAYMKVYALDDDANDVYSELITITQAAPVVDYATLPFCWEGGVKTDFMALNGITANGLGSDYAVANAPYRLKFDTDGDYIQVKTNGEPLNVTVEVKMVGGANTSTITVQGSADGEKFTDVETFTIEGAQNDVLYFESTKAFGSNDRYVRLLFTRGSNVGVGAITINCVRKSISDAEYATYCSPYNLDFSNVSDLTAYEATINGTTVAFNEGDKLFAAGEGILLKGDKGTYNIPVVATATVNTNNKLVGVLAEEEVAAGIYVLLNTNNNPGFYKTKSAFTVGAHTAYLPAIAGARDFIGIDDNTTTGVNSIDNGQLTIDNVYNLNGQRVNNAKKGLYIVNGKKVVIK